MNTIIEAFQYEWFLRAILSSSLVGIMCGLLGCFIVLRNMAMIGDALSHAILPGVVVAFVLAGGYSVMAFFIGSVVAGLLTAVLITWIQQRVKTKNDAAIGIVFTLMFSIGIIGISWLSKQQGVHLDMKDFLFGNVLGVSNEDLYLTGAIGLIVLFSVVVFYRYLFASTFQPIVAETMGISVQMMHYFLMLLLSFAVVAALRSVGVILVVAMLITPASTALLLSNRLTKVLGISALVGLVSAVTGMLLAVMFDTTPGPAMAIVATALYGLAVLLAPEKGLVAQAVRKRKLQQRIFKEDVIKHIFRQGEEGQISLEIVAEKTDRSLYKVKQIAQLLSRMGYLTLSPLQLNQKGHDLAQRLIRAHRLWETYLVHELGLDAGQIHDEAERYEHHLSDDMMDEVDQHLGFPAKDPHGSPIPTSKASKGNQ